MKYLRFYLDRDCVIVPGWGRTKRVRNGCDSWTLVDTQRNLDMLKKNAKVVNGTGGLLIVDVDPKNGGSVEALHRRFPDLPDTRTVQTVTPHLDGFGTHLIFTIPDDVRVANRQLGTGIDVPHAVMLPGSVVLCEDGVERTYKVVNEVKPEPPARIDRGGRQGPGLSGGDAGRPRPRGADGTVHSLVGKFAAAGPAERNHMFLQVAPAVIRLKGAEGANLLRTAYTGDNDRWLESALKSATAKYIGAAAPNSTLPWREVAEALRQIVQEARYGKWSGATGATDRKVMLGVIRMCASVGRMTAVSSIRALALVTGLEPKTVNSAVARLVESGRLYIVGNDPTATPRVHTDCGGIDHSVSKRNTP